MGTLTMGRTWGARVQSILGQPRDPVLAKSRQFQVEMVTGIRSRLNTYLNVHESGSTSF